MCYLSPVWRSIRDLPLQSEIFRSAASHSLSIDTLEVAWNPGVPNIAITERKQPDLWRWAVVSGEDFVIDEGSEDTQSEAKGVAVSSLERATEKLHLQYAVAAS